MKFIRKFIRPLKKEKVVITLSNIPKISLKKEFSNYNGPKLSKNFEWGNSKGREI